VQETIVQAQKYTFTANIPSLIPDAGDVLILSSTKAELQRNDASKTKAKVRRINLVTQTRVCLTKFSIQSMQLKLLAMNFVWKLQN
jgi:hypothetical protein